ncbi:MAG TPA: TlpA disulfide reductase family protein [Gaiellaceae bacterium]|nr:TlpA disulfide reductase family protein [Gaiellaceae bacterium]
MFRLKLVGQVAALGLVALLLGLLIWKVVQNDRSSVAQDFNRGKHPLAVDFDLKRLNGDGSLRLSSLRGKVVVINFWATWCQPCKKEAPRFQSAFERYRGRVAFVGVDTTDFTGDGRAFLARYGVSYPNVRDPAGRVLHKYGGSSDIPRTFVVGRTGRVQTYIFGEARASDLESAIREALAA